MKKVLFIDRDGTLIKEPADQQIDSLEKLEFYPGVIKWLGKIVDATNYELVLVSNQDGLGTAQFPENTFWPAHTKMIKTLANEGIVFSREHIDPSLPAENKPTRKPEIGMLTSYFNGEYDLKSSFVIGDRLTDIQLAKNVGCKGILLNSIDKDVVQQAELNESCALITSSWKTIYEFLVLCPRKSTVVRTTKETDIRIELNLDGEGIASCKTGIGFFDHMLEQIARHGQLDLMVKTSGDLHIDEHHTIEDTALALGEAFRIALGDKRGIERYGFSLPMDDCLAQVALDFGGRPWLAWKVEFKRERVGEMPTEMCYHFFKSFSDTAKCNLNIQAEGVNEHHKAEAIFKAFAKTIKIAKRKDVENMSLPTTKGLL